MTAAATAPRVFHGWVVVGAASVIMFLAYGLQFSYGVFVAGMSAELGWSRADTALPYALYVFVYSALSAATGRATDRIGPRQVITVGAVLLGCGWGLSALVQTPWQLALSLGLVAALGMSVAWVPCNATVARWFTRRRGTAVALASTGASVGNFLVPPLAAVLLLATSAALASCADGGCHAFHSPCCPTGGDGACVGTGACAAGLPAAACAGAPLGCRCQLTPNGCKCCG